MLANDVGRRILLDQPRVTTETWNPEKLLALPEDTFGHQYVNWIKKFGFSADERPVAKYV